MSTRNRDVKLSITAQDMASGPIGRAVNSVDRLKDSLAGFDAGSEKGVARSFNRIAQTVATSGRAIDREIGVLTEGLETRGKNLRAALSTLNGERGEAAALRKRANDIKRGVVGIDRSLKDATDTEAKSVADRAALLTRRRKEASDKVVRDAKAILARERAAILAAGGRNAKQRAEGYGNLERRISDEGLTPRNQTALFRKVGKTQSDAWKAELAGIDYDRSAFEQQSAIRAKRIDDLKNMRAVEERRLKDTEREYGQTMARVNKLRGQIRGSIDGIRNNRTLIGKAQIVRDEFRSVSARTETVRAAYDQNKDRAAAATAVDNIAGAKGNVARTAAMGAENRRLAAGTDVATSAIKRKNAALKDSGSILGSVRSQLAGLVSGYIIFSTVIGEAGKAIEVFRSRQAFDAKIGATNNNNLQDTASQLAVVRKMAEEYGLEIVDLQSKYSSFAVSADAVGISTEQVQTIFDGLSAAARVNKLTQDQFSRAVVALTQSMSKNQVMAEELKQQLAEALPGAVGLFAQAMGYGSTEMAQFYKDLEGGKFDGQDIVRFGEFLKSNFAESAKIAGDSFDAMLNRFYNSLSYAREAFANAGLMDGLMSFMKDAQAFFESDDGKQFVVQIGQAAEMLLNVFGMIVRNLDTIVMVLGSLVLAKFAKAGVSAFSAIFGVMKGGARVMGSLAKHAGSLSKIMRILKVSFVGVTGPLGAAITGIAFLTPMLMSLFGIDFGASDKVETTKKLDQIAGALSKVRDAAVDARGDVDAFNKSLADISTGELRAAADGNKTLVGSAKAQLKGEIDSFIAPREYDFVRGTGRSANVASPSLQSNRMLRDAFNGLADGTLPYQELDKNKDSYLKTLEALRKASILSDDEFKRLSDQGKALAQRLADEKALNRALEARGGDAAASKAILDEQSAELAEENAKKLQMVEEAIKKVEDAAKDPTGMKALGQMMKDNQSSIRTMTKALEDNRNALKPEQYEAFTRRISEAHRKMSQEVVQAFLQSTAAANGFELKLSDFEVQEIAKAMPSGRLNPASATGDRNVRQGIVEAAAALGIDPVDLATAISYETAGTFDPMKKGPTTQWGQHRGLIQFGEPQARENGVDFSTKQRATETQLGADGAVVRYLRNAGVKPGMGLLEIYSAINAGGIGERYYNRTDANNGGAPGTVRQKVENQMGGHRRNAEVLLGWEPVDTTDRNAGFATAAERDAFMAANQGIKSITSAAGYGERASGAIGAAVRVDNSLATNPDFLMAIQEKKTEDIAKFLAEIDQRYADEFIRQSSGEVAEAASKKVLDDAQKAAEDNKKAAEQILDNQRETRDALLAEERERFISQTRAELQKRATEAGTPFNQALFDSELQKFDAEQRANRNDTLRSSTSDSRSRVAQSQAANDLARERIRLEQAADDAKLDGLQKELFVRNGIAAFEAEQQKNARDAQDAAIRSAENEVALARELTGLGRARLAVEQEIAEEEAKTGVKVSAAYRAARVRAAEDAFKASNPGWQSEEARSTFDRAAGQRMAERDTLMSQLEVARSIGDTTGAEKLREEIAGINAELLEMIDNAIAAMSALGGTENKQALEAMKQMRIEIASSKENITRYGQAAQYWGQRAGDVLADGMNAFSKAVAENEKPWRALGEAVSASIGQILIDISTMVMKAIAAKAIMSAMGVDQAGMPTGGGLGASSGPMAGFFKSMLTAGFSAMMGGGMPVFHEGGVAGDRSGRNRTLSADMTGIKSNEILAVLERGEEVLTANDPRHRNNFRQNYDQLQRYHFGGIVGLAAEFGNKKNDDGRSTLERFMTGIRPGMPGGVAGTIINNHFDGEDFINRTLAGPLGVNIIANVISKNPRKFKSILGQ